MALAALLIACSSEADKPAATTMVGGAGAAQAGANAAGGSPAGNSSGGNGTAGSSSGGQAAGTTGAGGTDNVAGTSLAGAGGSSGSGGMGGAAVEPSLVASPTELAFGAVQQTQTPPQTIALKNPSAVALQLASVTLDAAAAGTPAFELVSPPAAGAVVAPGGTTNLQVRFRPTGIALFKSSVMVVTQAPQLELTIGLFGLGTKGLEGENEPFLKIVLDAIGYDVDVGGAGLLSTTTPLVGDEVAAQRFRAASAAEIELIPVARYSPQEPIPYGYYDATEVQVGVIADDQYQALNPTTDAGSKRSFVPPAGEFGIFTTSGTHTTYTEDSKNAANQVKHAVRTYPLKDRAGAAIPSSYLVCFEEAANGDYQDYVFTLSNVVPVAP
ncbi:MAG TPA: hypothetical protein VIW29_01865 [Polyangiaceae bacterium]